MLNVQNYLNGLKTHTYIYMNNCIQEITEQLYKYKEKKNIEIEARLGFFNIGKFDSNITEFFLIKLKINLIIHLHGIMSKKSIKLIIIIIK